MPARTRLRRLRRVVILIKLSGNSSVSTVEPILDDVVGYPAVRHIVSKFVECVMSSMFPPSIVTGDLVFEYTATEVTQPETVMQTIALVKGEIAKAQLALGGKAVDALANGIVGALLGGGGILPGGVAVPAPSE